MYAGAMKNQLFPVGMMVERQAEDNFKSHVLTKEMHEPISWINFENQSLHQHRHPRTASHRSEMYLYCQHRKSDKEVLQKIAR